MSEYPYLTKGIKYYEERKGRRPLTSNERSELKEIKTAVRKAQAFDDSLGAFEDLRDFHDRVQKNNQT